MMTPRGGILTRIYARIFPSAWVDDELLDFLKLLQDRDWTRINWNGNWIVIPILPKSVLDYCLPGIMYWILTDPDFMPEAADSLVEYSLVPPSDEEQYDFSSFNSDQKEVIGDFLLLFHDLTLTDNLELQQRVRTTVQYLKVR